MSLSRLLHYGVPTVLAKYQNSEFCPSAKVMWQSYGYRIDLFYRFFANLFIFSMTFQTKGVSDDEKLINDKSFASPFIAWQHFQTCPKGVVQNIRQFDVNWLRHSDRGRIQNLFVELRTLVLKNKGQTDSMVFVSEDWLR